MSVLDPKKVITREGMKHILSKFQGTGIAGAFKDVKAWALVSATVAFDDRSIESGEVGVDGLEEGLPVALGVPVIESNTGKIYRLSGVLKHEVATPTGSQTVVGIMLGETAAVEDAYAYLQLGDPVTLDADGESVQYAIEIGFDGQSFYIEVRVLPAGE